jgi:hypothetical protein
MSLSINFGLRRDVVMRRVSQVVACLTLLAVSSILQAQTTVSVKPRAVPITPTETQKFSAIVSNAASQQVTWQVDGVIAGNSTVGTIDVAGLYTPGTQPGRHVITATTVLSPAGSGTATVYVNTYPGEFTYHHDIFRTGQNRNEIALRHSNVNAAQFGKLFSYPVDGYIFAQPLYVANLMIPGKGYHNVVYIVTEHDSLYAFDAEGRTAAPLWKTSFIDPVHGITTIPTTDLTSDPEYQQPEFGITATPVIDPASSTIYVHVRTKENGTYVQRLHALDLATGAEKLGGPVRIQASVSGTGVGSVAGILPYDTKMENVRSGLLLCNGVVYLGAASLGDQQPYHGWVLPYDARTLAMRAAFNTSSDTRAAGVWQMGAGLSCDSSGNIFLQTGNGPFTATSGGSSYGDSVLKMTLISGRLRVTDFFTPYNQDTLRYYDWDLGAGGALLIPDQPAPSPPHLLVGGGKEGTIYLLNREALGGYNPAGDTGALQTIVAGVTPSTPSSTRNGLWGVPAFWRNNVYIFGEHDVPKMFRVSNGQLSTTPVSQGSIQMLAPVPVITANGINDGIAWALSWQSRTLYAFDANDLSVELYDNKQAGTRDVLSDGVVRNAPLVVNGRVYVGTKSTVDVFGLLP